MRPRRVKTRRVKVSELSPALPPHPPPKPSSSGKERGARKRGRPRGCKLPKLGRASPFQVSLAAGRQALHEEDRLELLKWRRSRGVCHALWEAAVEGLAERLLRAYIARWAAAHRRPVVAWKDSAGNAEEFCRKGAAWLLEFGFTIERLLDVAEEVYSSGPFQRVVYPPLRNVLGPAVLATVPEWIPPGERFDRAELREAEETTLRMLKEREGYPHPWETARYSMMGFDFRDKDSRKLKAARARAAAAKGKRRARP